jgi:hypothetical protein
MLMSQRTMRLKMKGSNHSIEIMADSSMLIDQFLLQNGLMPRDGSLRYAMDSNGTVLRDCIVSNAPGVMYLGLPDKILSTWVDTVFSDGVQTKTILENGAELYVPGLNSNEHYNIFISRKSTSKNAKPKLHGYRFRTDGNPYHSGDYLYVRVPKSGKSIMICDPITGTESIKTSFDSNGINIDMIRGLWCVCTFQLNSGNQSSLKFSPEHTYFPPNFKPLSVKPEMAKQKRRLPAYWVRKVKGKNLRGLFISKLRSKKAYIAGSLPKKGKIHGEILLHFIDATGESAFIVNSYRDQDKTHIAGDTLHLRVPKSGNMTTIFNSKSGLNDRDVKINPPPNEGLASFRGSWVIALVCKNQKIPNVLQVIIDPSLSKFHQTRFKME